MSLTDNPRDKRHFHGVFATKGPFKIEVPVRCLVCSRLIDNACEIVPGSVVCHRCWLDGWREPVAFQG